MEPDPEIRREKVFLQPGMSTALAQSLYADLIQEAVTKLFKLSGKTKEMANGKYSEKYAGFWIAPHAMLAFLKTWERQNKWCTSFEELANPIREGKRLYSPDFGLNVCLKRMGRGLG